MRGTEHDAAHARPTAGPSAQRCRDEVAHAAVATVPGIGAIDVLVPTCDRDRAMVVWAMRGHTLSRIERPLSFGAPFRPGVVVSTGADRLGPASPRSSAGPIAWRSPTLALDETETDEVWAGRVDTLSDGGVRVLRGSVSMPAGVAGLGVTAAIGHDDRSVQVLMSVAQEGENPRVVRFDVSAPSDQARTLEAIPRALMEGELKAFEPEHGVLIAYGVRDDNARELRIARVNGDRVQPIGTVPLATRSVLVVSRGVALRDRSLFVYASFELERGDGGSCVALDARTCVRAGDVTLLSVGTDGVRQIRAAEHGLPDTLALDAQGRALVMYLSSVAREGEQRTVRVDVDSGRATDVRLRGSNDVPPLDHPALVTCAGEPWLVAEVLVQNANERDTGVRRESAVMAFPFECLVAPQERGNHD